MGYLEADEIKNLIEGIRIPGRSGGSTVDTFEETRADFFQLRCVVSYLEEDIFLRCRCWRTIRNLN